MGISGKELEAIRKKFNKISFDIDSKRIDSDDLFKKYTEYNFSNFKWTRDKEIEFLAYYAMAKAIKSSKLTRVFSMAHSKHNIVTSACLDKIVDFMKDERQNYLTDVDKIDDNGNAYNKAGEMLDGAHTYSFDPEFIKAKETGEYNIVEDEASITNSANKKAKVSVGKNRIGVEFSYTQREIKNQIEIAKNEFSNIDADASYLDSFKRSIEEGERKYNDVSDMYLHSDNSLSKLGIIDDNKEMANKQMSVCTKDTNSKMLSMYLAVSDEFSKRNIFSKIFLFVRTIKQYSFIKNCEEKLNERGFNQELLDKYKEMYNDSSKIDSVKEIKLNSSNNDYTIDEENAIEDDEKIPGLEESLKERNISRSSKINQELNRSKDYDLNND